MIASSFYTRGKFGFGPKVTYNTNKQRRIKILLSASEPYGCLCNAARCSALTNEPNMKWLLKKGFVVIKRELAYGWFNHYSRFSRAYITEEGKQFLKKQKISTGY